MRHINPRHYNPIDITQRRKLAEAIRAELSDAKFKVATPDARTKEEVWEYQTPHPKIRILVYTTIVGNECRRSGADAIRACAVYKNDDGKEFGLIKITRVNRSGEILSICERVRDRIRAVYQEAARAPKCHCGAPTFMTKAKPDKPSRPCCAELCWKKPVQTKEKDIEDGTVEDDKPW